MLNWFRKTCFGLGASLCLTLVPAVATAGPLDDLVRGFERTCMVNAGKADEFSTKSVESGLKRSKAKTSLRVFWKAGQSCRLEYQSPQKEARNPELVAKLQNIAVGLAGRIGGTVELRRKGKRNEHFRVRSESVEYWVSIQAERSGRVTGLSISRF
ncbi:MAG: hypothetical protein AB8B51_00345 [Sedimentitalea sp.]